MYTEKELQSQKDKAQEISSIFGEKSLKVVEQITTTLENLLAWDDSEFTAVELGYWYNIEAELKKECKDEVREKIIPEIFSFLRKNFTYDNENEVFQSKKRRLGAGTGDDSSLFIVSNSSGTTIWWKENRGFETTIFDGKELKTEEEFNQVFELLGIKEILKWI